MKGIVKMKKMNEILKERRKELGFTADELAKMANVSRATLYRYESGELSEIPSTTLVLLAKALKTDVSHLLGEKNKKESDNEALMFALYGTTEIDEELLDDVRKLALIQKELRDKKKENS